MATNPITDFGTGDLQQLAELSGMLAHNVNQLSNQQALQKSMTPSTGFVGYNLEPMAKWMMPFFHGFRKRLPVKQAASGAANATWREQLGESSFAYGPFGSAAAAIGPDALSSALTFSSPYQTQAVSGKVGVEALHQAMGWDNAMSLETVSALTRLFKFEEYECLGANNAALTMTTVTANPSTLTSPSTFSNAVWSIAVTALTLEGAVANAAANSNTGETALGTAFVDVSVGAGTSAYIDISWPAVVGAVGYKIYADHTAAAGHGAAALFLSPVSGLNYSNLVSGSFLSTLGTAITPNPSGATYVTVNHVQLAAVPANTQPNPPTTDGTANANTYEGLIAWASKSTILSVALPYRTVTDQGGAILTQQSGGIAEFDTILQKLWQDQHASPSLILCSSKSVLSVTNRIIGGGSNQYRFEAYQNRNQITGGLYVNGYVNKFASDMIGQNPTIRIWAHPYLPDGTFVFVTEDVPPETLPYAQTAKTFELDTLIPYSYFPLGPTDRSFPFSVYVDQTLKCFWPSAQAMIQGVRVDS